MEVLRNQVSVVLQKNTLFSGTILENLRWGNPDATEEEWLKRAGQRVRTSLSINCRRAITPGSRGEGANVSGGQKQRLCIARALFKEAKGADPRRFHQRRGYGYGRQHSIRLCERNTRNHQDHHSPESIQRGIGRSNLSAQRRKIDDFGHP